MNIIVTISIVILSCCIGIISMSTILSLYIHYFSKKVVHVSIALIGILGLFTITAELLVIICGTHNNTGLGFQFHRIEAILISFYLFALPYIFHNLLEMNIFLKKINTYVYISGFALGILFLVTAYAAPELFLSINNISISELNKWHIWTATPGTLYRVRDILLASILVYSIILLVYELKVNRNRDYVRTILAGLLFGIILGAIDIIMNMVEINTGLYSYRIFSYSVLGFTAFTVIAMLAVVKLFIEQSQALENVKKNEYMELIAGGIAHDFNNLLTGILGNTSLALFNADSTDKNIELLTSIQKAAKRGRGLSRQLLDFSRGGILVRGIVSIEKIIKENVSFILSGSAVVVEYIIDESLWNVNVDETQISQVIQNLAVNANQAMEGSGNLIFTCRNFTETGKFSILKPGRYVRIDVKDTGPGIPEEHLKNIFDPYFTTKRAGTGLGLATTLSIIKKHDGHIEVDSRPGDGATFTLYLPATDKTRDWESRLTAKPVKFSGKALIMDDEKMILGVGMKMLAELGFEAECVTCGEDAVDEYKKSMENGNPYKIVIMDLTITGGMGGNEAVKRIKQMDPASRVIISTGYSHELTQKDFSTIGFDGALSKPYTIEEMRASIFETLNSERRNTI